MQPKHMKTFKNVKEKREAKGITQERLAELLRVDTRTVQRWESTGKVRPCYHTDLALVLA